uniref:Uncharacterized protein n=1 Tax=Anguilla anguilla TaxID=7936 RepID=A0A0E9QRA3_ANGAN
MSFAYLANDSPTLSSNAATLGIPVFEQFCSIPCSSLQIASFAIMSTVIWANEAPEHE